MVTFAKWQLLYVLHIVAPEMEGRQVAYISGSGICNCPIDSLTAAGSTYSSRIKTTLSK